MHIAISASFQYEPDTGSGQYLRGLLATLPTIAPDLRFSALIPRFLIPSSGIPIELQDPAHRIRLIVIATPFDQISPNLAKLYFEQIAAPRAAYRLGADLLHIPYFAPPLFATLPVVVSILDLIPLLLPEYRGRAAVRAYMRLAVAGAARAKRVIAISQATADDLQRHLRIPGERITVTPLAAGAQYQPIDQTAARSEVARRYGIQQPYVYYVGGLDARKNVATLVRAYARLRRTHGPEALLVIAGRARGVDPLLFPDLDAVIRAEHAEAWVRRIEVPSEDGPLLYAAAEVFALPSRYEGFGLGPLEAMACGAPVIVADASSLPEVVGDAALLVPPDDIDGWSAALARLLTDAALREELRARGLARAAQFSYLRTATQTVEVYRSTREN